MMLAALIDPEDTIIQVLPVATAQEVSALNQRAQDADSGYQWRELSAFEQGLLVGLTLPVLKGMASE